MTPSYFSSEKIVISTIIWIFSHSSMGSNSELRESKVIQITFHNPLPILQTSLSTVLLVLAILETRLADLLYHPAESYLLSVSELVVFSNPLPLSGRWGIVCSVHSDSPPSSHLWSWTYRNMIVGMSLCHIQWHDCGMVILLGICSSRWDQSISQLVGKELAGPGYAMGGGVTLGWTLFFPFCSQNTSYILHCPLYWGKGCLHLQIEGTWIL